MSHFLLRAGENWQENPETYEDSFYKRSLDNDNYVFTAPYFNSKYYFNNSFISIPLFKINYCYYLLSYQTIYIMIVAQINHY